jgi:hypothetical protein
MIKLDTLFQDNSGGYSMMRVCFFIVVLTILGNWTYVNIHKKELQPLPDGSVALIAAVAGAKAIQRFGEQADNTAIKNS